MMTVTEFCTRHRACSEGVKWAVAQVGADAPMATLWTRDDVPHAWRLWIATRRGVMEDRDLRRFACRCVRETPLADGRKVWDLLTDPRSRAAVEVIERFADGQATNDELTAARAAARAAATNAAEAAAAYAYAAANAADAATAADAHQSAWLREMEVNF